MGELVIQLFVDTPTDFRIWHGDMPKPEDSENIDDGGPEVIIDIGCECPTLTGLKNQYKELYVQERAQREDQASQLETVAATYENLRR